MEWSLNGAAALDASAFAVSVPLRAEFVNKSLPEFEVLYDWLISED
jgi:hypothetical protein